MPTSVPVGSIVSYAAPTTDSLPSNWRHCDGSTLSSTDYHDLYVAIGTANGGTNQTFNLPDLRGRFLRGSAPASATLQLKYNPANQLALVAGQAYDYKTAQDPDNQIQVTFDRMPNSNYHVGTTHYIDPTVTLKGWNAGATQFPVTGLDSESRPDNVYMFFAIKTQVEGGTGSANLPLGSVVPYAGQDTTQAGTFPAWIKCNGTTVTQTDVPDLATLVGDRFADPSVAQNLFAPPNLVGTFIRGVDLEGKVDPDHSQRQAAPDGSAQGVGTVQKWATGVRNPNVSINYYDAQQDSFWNADYWTILSNEGSSSNQSWSGGAHETRPNNAAVQFYINSIAASTVQDFPVGGIIAVPGPGSSITNEGNWVSCDGSSYNMNVYATLYSAIGTIWGTDSTDSYKFRVPDLRAMFLRGSNTDGQGYNRGDPDWNQRQAITSGESQIGTGSVQRYATGKPQNLNTTITYWTGKRQLAGGGYNSKCASYPSGSGQYPLGGSLDNETAPAHLIVNFYIRAL